MSEHSEQEVAYIVDLRGQRAKKREDAGNFDLSLISWSPNATNFGLDDHADTLSLEDLARYRAFAKKVVHADNKQRKKPARQAIWQSEVQEHARTGKRRRTPSPHVRNPNKKPSRHSRRARVRKTYFDRLEEKKQSGQNLTDKEVEEWFSEGNTKRRKRLADKIIRALDLSGNGAEEDGPVDEAVEGEIAEEGTAGRPFVIDDELDSDEETGEDSLLPSQVRARTIPPSPMPAPSTIPDLVLSLISPPTAEQQQDTLKQHQLDHGRARLTSISGRFYYPQPWVQEDCVSVALRRPFFVLALGLRFLQLMIPFLPTLDFSHADAKRCFPIEVTYRYDRSKKSHLNKLASRPSSTISIPYCATTTLQDFHMHTDRHGGHSLSKQPYVIAMLAKMIHDNHLDAYSAMEALTHAEYGSSCEGSHICNLFGCTNGTHLEPEEHSINMSRNRCKAVAGQCHVADHTPPCIGNSEHQDYQTNMDYFNTLNERSSQQDLVNNAYKCPICHSKIAGVRQWIMHVEGTHQH